ncbi:hypothetical protein [Absidia glauca]|uniref:Alpha-1,4 glucan phosphorylase n=1 Tax=Absidia glauca TaxID=4829 RepID=A0A168MS14_ABSGL|nr:hypothetical protein [Absidia glauca]
MASHTSRPVPQRRRSLPNVTSKRMMDVVIHGDVQPVAATEVPSRGLKYAPLHANALARWKSLAPHDLATPEHIERSIVYHTTYTLCRHRYNVDKTALYTATSYSVRDLLLQDWNATQEKLHETNPKQCYYLSMEFLLGRALDNALYCLSTKKEYASSVKALGFSLEDLLEEERDAALGNGGLGRLAACYMDSVATLEYPVSGYGLRYQYGIFKQIINKEGYQDERPDYWLDSYNTKNCGNIRLWESQPQHLFDFAAFNSGDYDKAVGEQKRAANLTAVLYPNDNHDSGKELRLKQEYFWVCASLQDIIRRFKRSKRPWKDFSHQVALQLNDTHPIMAIVELQRLLVDVEGLSWDAAWDIVTKTFAFTNHTVLPEALERWPVPLMERLLPRHMQIIYDINLFFLQKVEKAFPGDRDLLNRMSIIEESNPQQVRMAYLGVVGSSKVNGVAALHSDLVKKDLFPDFVKYFGPDKFINITNGITPRRWLYQANPALRDLITDTLGSEKWVCHLDELIHEYKRQLLNILGVIHRYRELLDMTASERATVVPRVVIFGGKSAPGYHVAKMVIKLINSVATVVNNDDSIGDLLKVVFIPDYKVSLAEIITPASDISQHISTAGTEASGTSNMKFVLNGGLILGTVDGANIEIRDEIGHDNIFMFGTLADKVPDIRHTQKFYGVLLDANLQGVLDFIATGAFGDGSVFNPLIDTLTYGGDYYLISEDFDSYLKKQADVDNAFRDKTVWARKSIMCTAGMGFFSSDRAVREYADKIWNMKPQPLE